MPSSFFFENTILQERLLALVHDVYFTPFPIVLEPLSPVSGDLMSSHESNSCLLTQYHKKLIDPV